MQFITKDQKFKRFYGHLPPNNNSEFKISNSLHRYLIVSYVKVIIKHKIGVTVIHTRCSQKKMSQFFSNFSGNLHAQKLNNAKTNKVNITDAYYDL